VFGKRDLTAGGLPGADQCDVANEKTGVRLRIYLGGRANRRGKTSRGIATPPGYPRSNATIDSATGFGRKSLHPAGASGVAKN